jgi:cell division protein FtsL
MDNRSRTSRYPKNEYRNDREYINFRSVHNAALQPDFYPAQPQRKEQPRQRPTLVPQQQPKPKSKTFKRIKMFFWAAALTACACCLLARNAQIYENNMKIQALGAEITQSNTSVNNVKKDIAAKVDIVEYMQVAQDELQMDYPKENQVFALEVTPEENTNDDLTQIQKSNIVDNVLDWFNSLERRS